MANQYLTNRSLYYKTAKYWTYIYAVDEKTREKFNKKEFKDFEEKVKKLKKSLAITQEKALSMLSCANWNFDKAMANK